MTPSEVVEAVAAQIATDLAASGWTRSRYPIGTFPGDGRKPQHKSYSVGLSNTDPDGRDRQQHGAVLVQTVVLVRFAMAVRADNQVRDYGTALDGELALVKATKATTSDGKLHSILFDQVTVREMVSPTVYLGEIRWIAQHKYALA
ncbi:MAG: hypothetical protein GY913_15315 [Proteobacteria bacterium]|nr:hypothetical protein [Pseudomonadota bacterium]